MSDKVKTVKRTVIRNIVCILIIFVFVVAGIAAFCSPVQEHSMNVYAENGYADDSASDDTEVVYSVKKAGAFYDDSRLNGIFYISLPFLDTKTVAFKSRFPYTDDFFRHSSGDMSIEHARASLGMAVSAFRSTANVVDPQYETYLKNAGFTNLYSFGYDRETTRNSLSGIIGMKRIDDFTVIAAVTCGQGYQNEWAGNLIVGKGERHEGFDKAAKLLESYLDDYINSNGITGKKKLWLNGMSRAAAVANITAADMIESGGYDDVYAYLFGVPRTTKHPIPYKGIYNICGQYDPVSAIPFESWGFERYGTDFYTPAQESDSRYISYYTNVSAVSEKITGKSFRNNPEINYQLHLILEFLGDFFPTSDDYTDRFQDNILTAMEDRDPEAILMILTDAINETPAASDSESLSKTTFVNYISYIVGEHIRAEQRQVIDGSWDSDESLAANIVLEHRPATYVEWMFSDLKPEDLLFSSYTTRRIVFNGDVSLDVLYDGEKIASTDRKGKVDHAAYYDYAEKAGLPFLFLMRNGEQTVVNLPTDDEYVIEVTANTPTSLTYFDLTLSSDKLMQVPGMIYIGRMNRGQDSMRVAPGATLPLLSDDDTRFKLVADSEFDHSPTVIMKEELGAASGSSITIAKLTEIFFAVFFGMVLLFDLYLIIAFIHWRKRKKGHPPYSYWWIIVPHLIVIAVFTWLTEFMTYYMFSIGKARTECAFIAMLFVFILSLHGLIINRNRKNLLFTLFVLVLILFVQMYYNNLPIDSFSYRNVAAYIAIMLLLTLNAVRTFFPDGIKCASVRESAKDGINIQSDKTGISESSSADTVSDERISEEERL